VLRIAWLNLVGMGESGAEKKMKAKFFEEKEVGWGVRSVGEERERRGGGTGGGEIGERREGGGKGERGRRGWKGG